VENRRYLCSHLATLTIDGEARWVNIEEIWETGVVLESEAEMAVGVAAALAAGDAAFHGRTKEVQKEDFGWRVCWIRRC